MDYIISEPAIIKTEPEVLPGLTELLRNPDPEIRRAAELIRDKNEANSIRVVSLASVVRNLSQEEQQKISDADYVEFGRKNVTSEAKRLLTKTSEVEQLLPKVSFWNRNSEEKRAAEERLREKKKSVKDVNRLIKAWRFEFIRQNCELNLEQVKAIIESPRSEARKYMPTALSMWQAIRADDEVATLLAASELKCWRVAVAKATNDAKLLETLSTDNAQDVRRAVAWNDRVSDEILETLTADSSQNIAKIARTVLERRARALRKASEAKEVQP